MKIDRVHFYVEDARASCDWFVGYLGFQRVGGHYSSFHTRTEVVQSGSVCFWLSSPLSTLSPVAEFLRQHPPGVADVAFVVEDVAAVMARAQAHDVTILQPIQEYQQNGEYVKSGKIAAWGGLTHTLIERSRCSELQTSGDETANKPMSETTLAANKVLLKTTLFANET
ncbi:MAG: VOC family protein, partial [Nostocaceae cyanobacterium]|nr:VOC family protein [Nostocaceae cyanobacterium]